MTRIGKWRLFPVVIALVGVMAVGLAPSVAHAGALVTDQTYVFPSASSTVVGSVGFIDADEIGYFWSAARGDGASETFNGPASVKGVGLKLSVLFNNLNSGAHVDWTVKINGVAVARFRVPEGYLGPITLRRLFTPIAGPNYNVEIRVINEVASGQGSITLAYAGANPHALLLLAA